MDEDYDDEDYQSFTPKQTRPCRQLVVKVFVFELSTKKIIREMAVDIWKRDRREWLERLIKWAVQNGCSVEIVSITDFNRLQVLKRQAGIK